MGGGGEERPSSSKLGGQDFRESDGGGKAGAVACGSSLARAATSAQAAAARDVCSRLTLRIQVFHRVGDGRAGTVERVKAGVAGARGAGGGHKGGKGGVAAEEVRNRKPRDDRRKRGRLCLTFDARTPVGLRVPPERELTCVRAASSKVGRMRRKGFLPVVRIFSIRCTRDVATLLRWTILAVSWRRWFLTAPKSCLFHAPRDFSVGESTSLGESRRVSFCPSTATATASTMISEYFVWYHVCQATLTCPLLTNNATSDDGGGACCGIGGGRQAFRNKKCRQPQTGYNHKQWRNGRRSQRER